MRKSKNLNDKKWWETGVIYQIYPLTFADSNGDGIGDLQGIIKKLDYLNDGDPNSETSLGIDAIWLSPINQSPMIDNGYDVSDYYDISDAFGSLKDFDTLLTECHRRGIQVILDLVVNHTSNQHSWFIESSSSKDNPKSDWYHWQDPAPDGGLPNNWLSYFGGTGWTFNETRQQYYYHTFNENQPDLNWDIPEVKAAIFDIIRFWLDKGVDGFRLDASSVYSKDKFYRYNPIKFGASDKNNYNNHHHLYDKNLPENHQIIREIRKLVDEYKDRVLIGETFIDNRLYESTMFYGVNNDELHLAFTFEFPFSPWYPGYLQREIIKKELITPNGAWPTYFLDNHDIPRHLSRWIECSLCTNPLGIAQASAAILLTIRGTPFLYYGQEIGMVDNLDIPPDQIKDNAIIKSDSGESPPPRDSARTPMQWNDDVNAGFSFGKDVEPWLPVNENYTEKNVEKELNDPNSLLNFYRQLIKARKNSEALRFGRWSSLIHYPYEHLAYTRKTEAETVLVLINFSYEKDLTLDEYVAPYTWEVLVSNEREVCKIIDLPSKLYPFEVSVLRRDN
ncbi:glycoside hydrolase family 13 protein [Crocosphaera chwakensis]|uniref:Alpha amylase, catalytic region n=1 Tax=Crocosphaera chwakensis CCY0110 TaxID=391612 RepID=A3IHC8_9CHRO|nr:alpha-glucosidase [Crocosphaera chwakensis]EAZ94370.1 alpha amylase, catalytic region [Crocosphaera chwakensis CCY0110]